MAKLSLSTPFSLAKKFTVCIICDGSFDFPLKGSGERYGESVSTNIRLFGMEENVSAKSIDFLKVTTPLEEI